MVAVYSASHTFPGLALPNKRLIAVDTQLNLRFALRLTLCRLQTAVRVQTTARESHPTSVKLTEQPFSTHNPSRISFKPHNPLQDFLFYHFLLSTCVLLCFFLVTSNFSLLLSLSDIRWSLLYLLRIYQYPGGIAVDNLSSHLSTITLYTHNYRHHNAPLLTHLRLLLRFVHYAFAVRSKSSRTKSGFRFQ